MSEVVNRVVPLARYRAHPENYNEHPAEQIADLRHSLRIFGQVRSVVVQDDGQGGFVGVAGHGVIEAAQAEGKTEIKADVIPAGWPAEKVLAYLAADNEIGKTSAPDLAKLAGMVAKLKEQDEELAALAAGGDARLKELLAKFRAPAGEDPGPQVDRAAELQEKWKVRAGDLWQLGEHRLICGDCTDAAVVTRAMDGEKADCIVIDPPYSSGGFQEAGKSSGSIGTRSSQTIQRDNLSTRGYRLLILDALANFADCDSLYVFTDWRMWIECFDIAERAGWRVRSMLVWDKEQMGMGLPWRSQHELILYGKQTPAEMMDGKRGNVLHAKRTGNVNHPTEKPVEIIEQILENTPGQTVVDFFLGSGTTLIACQNLGRRCRAVEIAPNYVAVALERWAVMTGKTPVLLEPAR